MIFKDIYKITEGVDLKALVKKEFDKKSQELIKHFNVMCNNNDIPLKYFKMELDNFSDSIDSFKAYSLIVYLKNECDKLDSIRPLMCLKNYKTSSLKKDFDETLLATASYIMLNKLNYDPETYYDADLETTNIEYSKIVKKYKW